MNDPTLEIFALPITETDDAQRTVTVRLVPFDQPIEHNGRIHRYEAGSLAVPDELVPFTISHEDSVPNRVGRLARSFEGDDGLYGEVELVDTAAGRDLYAQMAAGVVAEISAGVWVDWSENDETGERPTTGRLDHIAAVPRGAFGPGAQVLAVHEEEALMPEMTTEEAPAVERYDDSEIRDEVRSLASMLETLGADRPADAPAYTGLEVFTGLLARHAGMTLENHALADVVGDLGTADASGLSPDYYWSAGLQQNVDRRRPFFANMGSAKFPDYGNNLQTGKVTQEPEGESTAGQKSTFTSVELQVSPVSFPVTWHKIALDIAIELAEQSSPDALTVAAKAMLRWYAKACELDANALASVGATIVGATLDTSTYAALAAQVITQGALIEDATGEFGDKLGVSTADFGAILGLTDAADRRQFSAVNPSNADGSAPLTAGALDIGGVLVFRSAAITNAIQFNTVSLRAGERNPIAVGATNVEKMGYDRGYIGATVIDHWGEGVYKYTATTAKK